MVGKEKNKGILRTNDITNMTKMFKARPDCQRPRIALIEGDPGVGKTTYCQKLAYDWATKQDKWDPSFPEIEVLLLLKCHEIKSDIWEAIDDQVLSEEMDNEAKECFFKFIRENQSKVLLVLDGLDEAEPCNLKMVYNLVEGKELSGCYIVLTSLHEAGKNVRRYCDTLWEIVGFTEDAKSIIRKYFENANKEHLARKLIKMVWPVTGSLKSGQPKDLQDLTKNPLNTALLCVIWEDLNGFLPTSRTKLYIEIVLCVLRRYEQKQGLLSENEDLLSVYNKDLLYLGRMALESLQNGELCFEEHISDGRCIVLSKMGFLSLQSAGSKRRVRARYAFSHKSFQEFFSGFFLACKLIKGKISCESIVSDQRYESELYQVFVFLIEILVSKSKKTAESLVKSVAANINFTSLKLDTDSAKDVSKRVLFAVSNLSEHASLLQTLGEHLNFTQLKLRESQINDSGCASLFQAFAVNSSLTILDLSKNNIFGSGVAPLSQFLAVNSSLTNLDLSCNHIGESGAASLSRALTVNSSLTNLDLERNGVGDSGAASLSQALAVNSSLSKLDLSWNGIGDSGAASFSQALAVNSSLTKLGLKGNLIADFASLSQALAVNSSLTKLDLSCNSRLASGVVSLFKVLAVNSSLTKLDLSMIYIGDFGAAFLSQILAVNSSLTELILCSSDIHQSGAASLSKALAVNSSLTKLGLSENGIRDSGAASLSKAIAVNSSLTKLDLCLNKIGDSGAASLSQALAVNSSLTNLDLSKNSIDDSGATSLSQALAVSSSLTKLDLSWNKIGDSGAASLSQALAVNSSLTNLDLSWNEIGDSGAASLSQALVVNSSLTNLNLSRNSIGDSGAASLSQALVVNSSLTNLNLSRNSISYSGAVQCVQDKYNC